MNPSKSKLGALTLFCIVIICLTGQVKAVADSAPPPNYMMGYYDPDNQTGYSTYADEAPQVLGSTVNDGSYAQEVVRLVNLNRRRAALLPLKINSLLTAMAQSHSTYMRDHACFGHQCPGQKSPAERICNAGYWRYGRGSSNLGETFDSGDLPKPGRGVCYIGEAIAAGYPNPNSVVAAWMGSPGHYAILMHPKLREIGVGYVTGGYYRKYWTADLGSQPNILPVFINYDEPETVSHRVKLSLTNEEVSNQGGIDYAHDVMISNNPNFADAHWETYAAQKPWMLTQGSGLKTVHVKYRDPTGYEILSADNIFSR